MSVGVGGRAAAQHITVREAARLIGVHENTLRKWEERGIIRAIRLPGSGFRRVPAAEVERVRSEMWGDIEPDQHPGFAPKNVPKGVFADDGYDELP